MVENSSETKPMSLARNTLVQSSLTLVSRVLGFVRDVILAARIGTGPVGDAFVTALMFPNSFRRILAEGAFSQAFVPSYAQELEGEGQEAARILAQDAMRALFVFTLFLVIILQIAMPWVMRVIHMGYAPGSEGFNLAVLLTQITMPYLVCMGLAALLSGVLNAGGRFILSAAAPTVLNFCILSLAFIGDSPAAVAFWVAVAVTMAGVFQVAILWWGVRRQGINLRLGLPRWNPKVQEVLWLAIPGVIAASSTQLNLFVSQSLASWEQGAKTWIFYADRLYQLPLGLIAIPLGIAILPPLARAVRRQAETVEGGSISKDTQDLMDQGLALSLGLTLPAALALLIAPTYLIDALFVRDNFTIEDASRTGAALFHFGWGLPAFVLIKVLTPAFFARKDTKTPMYFGLVSIALNVVLCLVLFKLLRDRGEMGYEGLAMATAFSAWANVGLLAIWLHHRQWYALSWGFVTRFGRVLLACVPFGVFLYWVVRGAETGKLAVFDIKLLDCVIFMGTAGVLYLVCALVFGVVKVSDVKAQMRAR